MLYQSSSGCSFNFIYMSDCYIVFKLTLNYLLFSKSKVVLFILMLFIHHKRFVKLFKIIVIFCNSSMSGMQLDNRYSVGNLDKNVISFFQSRCSGLRKIFEYLTFSSADNAFSFLCFRCFCASACNIVELLVSLVKHNCNLIFEYISILHHLYLGVVTEIHPPTRLRCI